MKQIVIIMLAFGVLIPGASAQKADKHPNPVLVKQCKFVLDRLIKTPSTLRFFKEKSRIWKDQEQVIIEYDAQNLAGVPIRSEISCSFSTAQKPQVMSAFLINSRAGKLQSYKASDFPSLVEGFKKIQKGLDP